MLSVVRVRPSQPRLYLKPSKGRNPLYKVNDYDKTESEILGDGGLVQGVEAAWMLGLPLGCDELLGRVFGQSYGQ